MSQGCGCSCRSAAPVASGPAPTLGMGDTVGTAVRDVVGAVDVLRSFGIDTCCGKELTLAQAAAGAGVPVEVLLRALGREEGRAT